MAVSLPEARLTSASNAEGAFLLDPAMLSEEPSTDNVKIKKNAFCAKKVPNKRSEREDGTK